MFKLRFSINPYQWFNSISEDGNIYPIQPQKKLPPETLQTPRTVSSSLYRQVFSTLILEFIYLFSLTFKQNSLNVLLEYQDLTNILVQISLQCLQISLIHVIIAHLITKSSARWLWWWRFTLRIDIMQVNHIPIVCLYAIEICVNFVMLLLIGYWILLFLHPHLEVA